MEIEVDEDDGPPPVSPPPVVPPSPARREDRTGERRPSNSVDGSGVLGTRGKPQKVVEKPSAETTRLWYLLQEKKTKAFGDWLSHWEGQREVNIKDKAFGWTPIHFAAHKGASHFVKLLAEGKAQLDTACGEGNTALMCAARQNNVSTVSYLVGKKANLNAVNNNGWSALIWCAINGCEEVATALLSASANYLTADNEGRTACMWAARHGHLSMVETLLANGLNLLQVDDAGLTVYDHAQEQLEMRSLIAAVQQVNEELQLAVRNNDVDGVKAAIEEGADVNVQDEDGWTPLMWAALHQSLDMVQLVIRHGANPNLVDERGEVLQMLSTDHLAVGESVIEIVSCNERLLEHAKAGRWHEIDHELQIGAWVNVRDEARRTVLLWAARSGACEAVTNLVNKNADLDARDESGWLPVHWAAQSGSVEMMCNLHYLGADFVSRTYVGETALHIAAQYNDGAMIQVLLASNADIEELNVDLRTALHMASVNGQTEALQTLLFYKADFEKVVEDESGMTAFLLAVTHERLSAVQCMLSDIPLPPRLPINAGTLSVAPKKAGKRTGSREPPERAVPGPKDPKAAGGTKAKAAPAPKTRIGNRKKLVKDVREKRGDHPRALLEHAAEIRTKLVKTPFGKIGRRLVNQCDLEERSALCLAVIGRHSNMVQILLSSKAELETTDSHGNGVLHYACMNRDREQVATFMDLNARVDRLNKDGLKPVDLCQEDPDILHMIERKLVSKKLETLPPSPTHVAPAVGINLEERHRIRFESPMLQTMGQEAILKELKLFIKQRGAPKAKNIQVELDPITARPRGHAYADFLEEWAAEMVLQGDGKQLNGQPLRVFFEIPFQLEHPAE